MSARGNLGNDPAIRAVGIILGCNALRHNPAITSNQRDRCFIAG